MGPVLPPQRKGRMHQYNQDKLKELQDTFDELKKCGVFVKPEQVNVSIEYLNLSCIVQKPNGVLDLLPYLVKLDTTVNPNLL